MAATYRDVSPDSSEFNDDDTEVPPPAGTVEGDLLAAIHIADFAGTLAAMTAPPGWDEVGSRAGVTNPECDIKIWKKIATASEPATYTFVDSGSSQPCLAILRIDGHDPAATLSVTFGNGVASTSHDAPSVTGVAGGLLITAYAVDNDGTAGRSYTTAPSGMTERADLSTTFPLLGVFTQALAANGATGTKTATCSASVRYVSASLVIPPAPAASGNKSGGFLSLLTA